MDQSEIEAVRAKIKALRDEARRLSESLRLMLQRERTAKLRWERISKGLCVVCGKFQVEPTYRCDDCNRKATKQQRGRRGSGPPRGMNFWREE